MRLLVTETSNFSPKARGILESHFQADFFDLDREGLLAAIPFYHVLWTRLRTMIDREILDLGKNLKAVATNTTGLNHIDHEYAGERKIHIVSLQGEAEFLRTIRATAELCLGLTLNLLRRIPQAQQHVLNGGWDRDQFRGEEVFSKTIGIIGYGRLGSIVARYFKAMDAEVLVCTKGVDSGQMLDGFPVVDLETLLANSDIVSLHADYKPENHKMFGHKQFASMKPTAYLINTARGELVDETSLIEAIRNGEIAGAAIDVLDNEIQVTESRNRILEMARTDHRLLVTPHMGGNTSDSTHRTEVFLAEKLVATLGLNTDAYSR